jgi:hypothetical protein
MKFQPNSVSRNKQIYRIQNQAAREPPFLLLEQHDSLYYYHSTPAVQENVMPIYKVIELSTVSDETIEECLNDWTVKGWHYDGMQFAMRESSKRPAMAFVLFTKEDSAAISK